MHRPSPGFVIPEALPILVWIFASLFFVIAAASLAVSSRRSRLALEANKKLVAELEAERAPAPSSSGVGQLLDALDVPGGKLIGAAADALLLSGPSSSAFPVDDFPQRWSTEHRGTGERFAFSKCAKPIPRPFKGKLRRSRRFPGWAVGEWKRDGRSGLVYSLKQGVGRPVVRVWYELKRGPRG